jgi:predicted RecA/RadA family phage recombinase
MSIHKYTSWGRTRTPKNILSGHRAGINSNGDGLAVNNTTSATFKTENQRFLVIEVSAIASGSVVVNGKMTAGSGTARALGSQPTINAVGVYIVDINGIDEVSFTTTANVTLFAAGSTF